MTNRDSANRGELLPLPAWMERFTIPNDAHGEETLSDRMQAYARANVERALAESREDLDRVIELAKGYVRGQYIAEVRAERLAEALREVDEYLAEREDVIDGDYGQPEANDEMRLRQVVRAALNLEPTP